MSNVTPFRRPAPKKPDPLTKGPGRMVMIVYVLAVLTFGVAFAPLPMMNLVTLGLAVATVAICASRREEGPVWARSHFEFVLRTVVIAGATTLLLYVFSAATSMIGLLSFLVLFFALAQLVVFGWVLLRVLVGGFRALRRKPNSYPKTLLV